MRVLLVRPSHWSPDGQVNFDVVEQMLAAQRPCLGAEDVVLLPELVGASLSRSDYLGRVGDLARWAGASVVGGSHHEDTGAAIVNRGAVVDPGGRLLAEYDKLHPYGVEQHAGVVPGRAGRSFELNGRRVHVLLCADLWYSASLARHTTIDAVFVPAFSLTQWDTPAPARALWQHMSVARAYEFMTYVAVSDWQHSATFNGQPCAGVSGLADPCPAVPADYFTGQADTQVSTHVLGFERLDAFRADRARRSFAGR